MQYFVGGNYSQVLTVQKRHRRNPHSALLEQPGEAHPVLSCDQIQNKSRATVNTTEGWEARFMQELWKRTDGTTLIGLRREIQFCVFFFLSSDQASISSNWLTKDRFCSCLKQTKDLLPSPCLRSIWEFQESAFICIVDFKITNFSKKQTHTKVFLSPGCHLLHLMKLRHHFSFKRFLSKN